MSKKKARLNFRLPDNSFLPAENEAVVVKARGHLYTIFEGVDLLESLSGDKGTKQ